MTEESTQRQPSVVAKMLATRVSQLEASQVALYRALEDAIPMMEFAVRKTSNSRLVSPTKRLKAAYAALEQVK